MANTGNPGMVLFAYISFALGGVLVIGGCIYMIVWAFCKKCLPCGKKGKKMDKTRQVGHAKYMDKTLSGTGTANITRDADNESLSFEGRNFLPQDDEKEGKNYNSRETKVHIENEECRHANGHVEAKNDIRENEQGSVKRISERDFVGAGAAVTTTAIVAGATTIIISEHQDGDPEANQWKSSDSPENPFTEGENIDTHSQSSLLNNQEVVMSNESIHDMHGPTEQHPSSDYPIGEKMKGEKYINSAPFQQDQLGTEPEQGNFETVSVDSVRQVSRSLHNYRDDGHSLEDSYHQEEVRDNRSEVYPQSISRDAVDSVQEAESVDNRYVADYVNSHEEHSLESGSHKEELQDNVGESVSTVSADHIRVTAGMTGYSWDEARHSLSGGSLQGDWQCHKDTSIEHPGTKLLHTRHLSAGREALDSDSQMHRSMQQESVHNEANAPNEGHRMEDDAKGQTTSTGLFTERRLSEQDQHSLHHESFTVEEVTYNPDSMLDISTEQEGFAGLVDTIIVADEAVVTTQSTDKDMDQDSVVRYNETVQNRDSANEVHESAQLNAESRYIKQDEQDIVQVGNLVDGSGLNDGIFENDCRLLQELEAIDAKDSVGSTTLRDTADEPVKADFDKETQDETTTQTKIYSDTDENDTDDADVKAAIALGMTGAATGVHNIRNKRKGQSSRFGKDSESEEEKHTDDIEMAGVTHTVGSLKMKSKKDKKLKKQEEKKIKKEKEREEKENKKSKKKKYDKDVVAMSEGKENLEKSNQEEDLVDATAVTVVSSSTYKKDKNYKKDKKRKEQTVMKNLEEQDVKSVADPPTDDTDGIDTVDESPIPVTLKETKKKEKAKKEKEGKKKSKKGKHKEQISDHEQHEHDVRQDETVSNLSSKEKKKNKEKASKKEKNKTQNMNDNTVKDDERPDNSIVPIPVVSSTDKMEVDKKSKKQKESKKKKGKWESEQQEQQGEIQTKEAKDQSEKESKFHEDDLAMTTAAVPIASAFKHKEKGQIDKKGKKSKKKDKSKTETASDIVHIDKEEKLDADVAGQPIMEDKKEKKSKKEKVDSKKKNKTPEQYQAQKTDKDNKKADSKKEKKKSWFGFGKSKHMDNDKVDDDKNNILAASAPIAGTTAVTTVTAAVIRETSQMGDEEVQNYGNTQLEQETQHTGWLDENMAAVHKEPKRFISNDGEAEQIINRNITSLTVPGDSDSDSLLIADSPGPRARSSPILYEIDEDQDSSFGATGGISDKKDVIMRDDEGYQTHDQDGDEDSSARTVRFDKDMSGEQYALIEDDELLKTENNQERLVEQRHSGGDLERIKLPHKGNVATIKDGSDTVETAHIKEASYREENATGGEKKGSYSYNKYNNMDNDHGQVQKGDEQMSNRGSTKVITGRRTSGFDEVTQMSDRDQTEWEDAAESHLSVVETEQSYVDSMTTENQDDDHHLKQETVEPIMAASSVNFSDDLGQIEQGKVNDNDEEDFSVSKAILADLRGKRNLRIPPPIKVKDDTKEVREPNLLDELHTVLRSKKKDDRESGEIEYDITDERYMGGAVKANDHLTEEYDISGFNVRARTTIFEKITEQTGKKIVPSFGGAVASQSYLRVTSPPTVIVGSDGTVKSSVTPHLMVSPGDDISDGSSDQVEYNHTPDRDSYTNGDLADRDSYTNGDLETYSRNDDSYDEPLDAIKPSQGKSHMQSRPSSMEETFERLSNKDLASNLGATVDQSSDQSSLRSTSTHSVQDYMTNGDHTTRNGHNGGVIDGEEDSQSVTGPQYETRTSESHAISEERSDIGSIKSRELNRMKVHDNFGDTVDASMVF